MRQRPPTNPFGEIPIAPPSPPGSGRKLGDELPSPFQPPFSRQSLTPKRTSSAATVVAILSLGAFLYLVCGYFVVPFLFKSVLTRTLAQHLDRPVTIGHVEFNPFTLRLTLANGIIGPRLSDPTDKVDPIVSFSTLTLDLDALSLPRRAIICQELSITQPFLHLVHNPAHVYNIASLLQTSDQPSPAKPLPGRWLSALIVSRYSINNIAISKGEILFDDQPTAKVHHLEELTFSLPAIANINYQNGQIKPHFSAVVNGTPIQMSGQAQMVEGAMAASLSLKMNNLDLASYKDYLPPSLGVQTLSGQADLDLNLLYAANAPPPDRFRLVGAMTLRSAMLSGGQDQFSVDSGVIKGGFSPAANLFQAEEISLHHPVWQRSPGHASLFDTLRHPSAAAGVAQDTPWPPTLAGILLADPRQGPTLPVNHLQITNGEIRELSKTDPESSGDWQAIDVSINTAQVTGGHDGRQQVLFTLNAKKLSGSRLSLQGSASTAPFEAKGLLVVNHTDIATAQGLWRRFGGELPVKSGVIEQVQANFSVIVDPEQRPQFLLEPLSIQAKDLRVELNGQLLEIPVWQSEQGTFTPSDPTLHLGRVQLQQATLTCRRESRTAAWQSILSAPPEQTPPAATPIDLNSLELTNASLLVENQGPPDISLRLERLDLQVERLDPQKANTISAAAMLGDKYPIQANGTFSLAPFSASLNIQASDLPLSTFQPILDRYFIAPINGTLSADGILSLPSLDYQGTWSIDALSAPLISCRTLSAEGTALSLRPLAVTIDRLKLQGPSLQMTANPNGMPQLPAIMQPGWQPAASSPEATVAIKAIDLDDGALFYDLPDPAEPTAGTPRAGLTLSVKKVTGSIEDFIVAKGQAIPFTINGLLETRAEFQAQGVIRPFAPKLGLELKSHITGLPLIALAPILDPYWGFAVKAGTLDFDNQLTYEDTLIQDSSRLALHGLSFGRPLAPEAIKAIGDTWQSLPLVQAMLQDATDTITLTVPVDGRTDTGFTYQTAMKAFLNQLLLKATVSPRNLLGSSQQAPSDSIEFQPGGSQLEAAAEEQLHALATFLQERPLLVIRLVGFADSQADGQALLTPKKMALPGEVAKEQALTGDKKILNLASKRAQAVQKFLSNQGVSPKQIRLSEPELIGADNAGQSGCRVSISFMAPK